MARLVILREERPWFEVRLSAPSLEVGADPRNDLRLVGEGIRPFHLAVRSRRRRWHAAPRGGPLEVEGSGAVPDAVLAPGVRLVLGPYRLEVVPDACEPERPVAGADHTRPLADGVVPAGGTPILRWIDPDGTRRGEPLGPGETVLGRSAGCDLRLEHPSVSARHARLVRIPGRPPLLEDLGSLNGCFLAGRRVFAAELWAGAPVRLGAVEITCETDERIGGGGPVFPPGLAGALDDARRAAPLREPCLLLGETGSGKEVMARYLHDRGPRAEGPFVPVNCGSLPRDLVESVLFGHRRGAFTGAVEDHRGAFERARRGTLFLDEIGEMSPEIQSKLLRALESGEVWPIGAEEPVPIDVRVVAATHRRLLDAVRHGSFRLDLWHRLAVFVIHIPPLRERPDDLGPLCSALLETLAAETGPRRLTPGALDLLRRHPWPGNLRELRNVLLRAAVEAPDEIIGPVAVRRALAAPSAGRLDADADPRAVVAAHDGNVTAAARTLGLARSTLRDLLARTTRSAKTPPAPHRIEPWPRPAISTACVAERPEHPEETESADPAHGAGRGPLPDERHA